MKKLNVLSHFSEKAIKKIMNSQTEVRAFKGWQVIHYVCKNPDLKAEEVSERLGVCRGYVYSVVNKYNQNGKDWYVPCQRGGRRKQTCYLSLEDEKLLMKSFEEDALSGSILTFRHIKLQVEEHVGKVVSDDYIWDLFSRHGWKKKVPCQHHPTCTERSRSKSDKAVQEEYKKNSKRIWIPNH